MRGEAGRAPGCSPNMPAPGPQCASSPTARAQPRPGAGTGPGHAALPCPQEPLGSAPGHQCARPWPGPNVLTAFQESGAGGGVAVPPTGPRQAATHRRLHASPVSPPPTQGPTGPCPEHHGDTVPGTLTGPPSSLGLPATRAARPLPLRGARRLRPARPGPAGHSPRLCSQPSFTMATSVMVPGGAHVRSPQGLPEPALPQPLGGAEGRVMPCPPGPLSDPAASPGGPSHPGSRPGPTFPRSLPSLSPRSHGCPQSLPLTLVPATAPAPWD